MKSGWQHVKKETHTTAALRLSVLILQLANDLLFVLVRSLQSVFNILKGEVSVLEKEYKARCITAQYSCQPHPETVAEVTGEGSQRVSTPNEHIYQFSRDAVDYQHLDKHTHTRSRAI